MKNMGKCLTSLLLLLSLSACTESLANLRRSDKWERVSYKPGAVRDLEIGRDYALYATDKAMYYSEDFLEFKKSAAPLPGELRSIAFGASDGIEDVFAVTDRGQLLRSHDHGKWYEPVGDFPGIKVYDLALSSKGLLFAASSSGLLVTDVNPRDGEETEAERRYFMPWEMLVLALPIWREANFGTDSEPWREWSVVLPGNCLRVAVNPDSPSRVYAEILDEGMYFSENEGASWEPIYAVDGARVSGRVAFGGESRVMIGGYLSEEGENKFRPLSVSCRTGGSPSELGRVFVPRDVAIAGGSLWAVDYENAIVCRSRDGAAWERTGRPIDFYSWWNAPAPALLAVDSKERLWVAAEGHGLFRFTAP